MCQIGTATEDDSANSEEALILIVSSIAFRLLLVLRFDEPDATRMYFTGEDAGYPFEEVRLEIGNLCCGALNRELLQVSPDLGMSTSYMISARYPPCLDMLGPGYVTTYMVIIDSMVRVDVTMCVCAHTPLDFVVDMSDEAESGGELELF